MVKQQLSWTHERHINGKDHALLTTLQHRSMTDHHINNRSTGIIARFADVTKD
jgi:hypothetical protein